MQLGYWGGIWGTTRPQNIMVSKMNTVSLATVEVGNPRLVVREVVLGHPGPCPLHLLLCYHYAFARRSSSPLHHPCSLKEGERKGEDDPGSPLQRERPKSHTWFLLISTRPRIQSCNHALLQESWKCSLRPVQAYVPVPFTYWRNERMDVEAEGQLTLSS